MKCFGKKPQKKKAFNAALYFILLLMYFYALSVGLLQIARATTGKLPGLSIVCLDEE